MFLRILWFVGLLILPVSAAAVQVRGPLDLPVEFYVPIAPTVHKADGKTHLVYELHLTNFASELTLSRIEVLADGGQVLANYEGTELTSRLLRPGLPRNNPEKQRLGGGMRAVLYIWVTFDGASEVPATLRHRVVGSLTPPPPPPAPAGASSGEAPKPEPIEVKGEGGEVRVIQEPPLVISPPLRGGEWLAANGPANASGHRQALVPVGGKTHIAQRFAIDWVQLREDGKTWTSDQLKNGNYRCYGADALAVGDAVVAGVKDGIPENVPGATSRAVPITLETVGGNYVILDLGRGHYAFYAHLQPGSLRVKTGDKVRRGQVLGLVGNSGNSTEPHLHFHISNGNSALGSEGLPYVFESFEQQGQGFGWKATGAAAAKHTMEMPSQNAVVRFPDSR
jgi:murein DD-endopeptidase MepM/ murein hydrolase activator NlpD